MKKYKPVFRILLAIAMIIVGALHFTHSNGFEKIVPDYLPHSLALVYISGFLEVLAAVGLFIPGVSRFAAWLLVVLYIAVFPANLYQAVNNIEVAALPHDPPLIWLRFPFQVFLVAWAWWLTTESVQIDG
ncbi:membrane protein-like protein [Gloeocapsa sp. PCC 7428]|uniref:DoxX family protein n=1 Tax=Gloeocapsa sp. PCC 7428 TaxID=1173026 RepID=UPI0002A5CD8F|nr:DoxX family protein [Gloeocapsa sp. PCC 7428]AFZ31445.1 membrane protein-like protein [Gloeocapsa sp. PCC 7428]